MAFRRGSWSWPWVKTQSPTVQSTDEPVTPEPATTNQNPILVPLEIQDPGILGEPTPSERARIKRKRILVFLVLSLVSLVNAFDATCICVILPTIAEDLDATMSETLSLGTTFLMALTVAQPLFTEVSYVHGNKRAYLMAMVLFLSGTTLCACAHNPATLLAGRCIQGAGAGGTLPLAAMILDEMFAIRERAQWVSFLNISWALGTVGGPILGGTFVLMGPDMWRWVFYINIPFLTIAFIGAWCFFEEDCPREPPQESMKYVDWSGALIFVMAAVSLLLPLVWAGTRYAWGSPPILAPLILSFILFISFVGYELRGARKPMICIEIFDEWATVAILICTVIHGALMWMILYFLSLYYLGIRSFSPIKTGIWALPATLTTAPMAVIVGIVLKKTGSYRWFLYSGWLFTTLILGFLIGLDADTPMLHLAIMTAFLGVGFGMLVPAMSGGIQATVKPGLTGKSVAMIYLMKSAGQCLGVALGQGIFSHRLEVELHLTGGDPSQARNMMKMIRKTLRKSGAGSEEQIRAVIDALQVVWITACALSGLGQLLAIVVKHQRLPERDVRARRRVNA